MKLPLYRRITEEELADAPKGGWKSKLLYAINLFMQQIYYGLANQLTPEENDRCQVKVFNLVGSATPSKNTFSFSTIFPEQPSRLTLGRIVPTDGSSIIFTTAPFVSWTFANSTLVIASICGLADGVPYQVTVEVRWPPTAT